MKWLKFFLMTGIQMLLLSSASATSYVHANEQLLAKVNDSGVYYHHPDHLGSTSAVTNGAGDLVEEQVNLPFGQLLTGEERYGFTGKELDETELNYFGARYYSPLTGRFLTVDPALQDFSSYAYAGGNPLTRVDPDGRKFKAQMIKDPSIPDWEWNRRMEEKYAPTINLVQKLLPDIKESYPELEIEGEHFIDRLWFGPEEVYLFCNLHTAEAMFPGIEGKWRDAPHDPLENPDIYAITEFFGSAPGRLNGAFIYLKDNLMEESDDFKRMVISFELFHTFHMMKYGGGFLGSLPAEEAECHYKTIILSRRMDWDISEKDKLIIPFGRYLDDLAVEDHQKLAENVERFGVLSALFYTPKVVLFSQGRYDEVKELYDIFYEYKKITDSKE